MRGLRARYGPHAAIRLPGWPDAACRTSWLPADVWADPQNDEQREAARNVCQGCPHLAPCRDFGVRHAGSVGGVWGGLSRAERIRLRRAQLREQQAASAGAA